MNLEEIKAKTDRDKRARLERISKLCGTDGDYKKNRKKPRARAEQEILEIFATKGYH